MFNIHLCDPQDNWKKLVPIQQKRGDISECLLKLDLNDWNQLKILINPTFSQYRRIVDRDDWGIRIETDDLDLGFILNKKKVITYNRVDCNLFSAAYRLYDSYLDNQDRYYSGSLATFLGDLSNNFVFTPLGTDVDIKIQTGSLDNFQLLYDAVRYKDFFSFVDAGLKDTGGGAIKPEIVYGNFGQVENYFDSTSDSRFKPIRIDNLRRIDNPDLDIAYMENYREINQAEPFTLLYAYAQTGQGSSANSRVDLQDPNASYIDPQFPLLARTSAITNRTTYYIRNPYALNYTERVKVFSPIENTNDIDVSGNLDIDENISPEILYEKAKSYIQSFSGEKVYNADIKFKKVLLPGNLGKIQFKQTYRQADNSEINETIQQDRVLDNLEFDLNETSN